jgi:hypothetical protein
VPAPAADPPPPPAFPPNKPLKSGGVLTGNRTAGGSLGGVPCSNGTEEAAWCVALDPAVVARQATPPPRGGRTPRRCACPAPPPPTHSRQSGGGCMLTSSGPGRFSSAAVDISTPTADGPPEQSLEANLVYAPTLPCTGAQNSHETRMLVGKYVATRSRLGRKGCERSGAAEAGAAGGGGSGAAPWHSPAGSPTGSARRRRRAQHQPRPLGTLSAG